METQLKKRKLQTLTGLKVALKQIWDEIPQNIIDNCLNAWPKRCYAIRKAKGGNIEHLLWKKGFQFLKINVQNL